MSKIDTLLKQNHNNQRRHLKNLAKCYIEINKLAFELKSYTSFETEALTDKLIDRLQTFEEIILDMLISHRPSK